MKWRSRKACKKIADITFTLRIRWRENKNYNDVNVKRFSHRYISLIFHSRILRWWKKLQRDFAGMKFFEKDSIFSDRSIHRRTDPLDRSSAKVQTKYFDDVVKKGTPDSQLQANLHTDLHTYSHQHQHPYPHSSPYLHSQSRPHTHAH